MSGSYEGILHFRCSPSGLLTVIYLGYSVDIEAKAQGNKSKDYHEEQCLVNIGKALYMDSSFVNTQCLGKLTTGLYLIFITLLVLGVVLIWHRLTKNHSFKSFHNLRF